MTDKSWRAFTIRDRARNSSVIRNACQAYMRGRWDCI